MEPVSFKSALGALAARNAALGASYRESAKSLLSRSATSLAASMADQRREFGKDLAELGAEANIGDEALDAEIPLSPPLPPPPLDEDVASLLKRMKKVENEDYETLSALSGALLSRSPAIAERLALFAEQARKRGSWAQDHLDLLGI
jgi:hypothetical protein